MKFEENKSGDWNSARVRNAGSETILFLQRVFRSELISTWKTFHWGTSGGAGTGEWIEKSAKFKINDINYREFVEKGKL